MRIPVVMRLPDRYTHPWLIRASLVVLRIPGCYTHPWLVSLGVIRIPGCYTQTWPLLPIPGRYTPP